MKRLLKNQLGYSLIEILVVAGLLVFVSMAVMSSNLQLLTDISKTAETTSLDVFHRTLIGSVLSENSYRKSSVVASFRLRVFVGVNANGAAVYFDSDPGRRNGVTPTGEVCFSYPSTDCPFTFEITRALVGTLVRISIIPKVDPNYTNPINMSKYAVPNMWRPQ